MAQNTEYFGFYRNSQLRYAVMSRRLKEYDFLLSFQSTESDIPD